MPNIIQARRLAGPGVLSDRAAQFQGNEKLSVPNDGSFSPPGNVDLHVIFWFAIDTFPAAGVHEIMNVSGNAVGLDGWFIFTDATNHRLSIGSSDGVSYGAMEFTVAPLTAGTWYMASCLWDNSGGGAGYEIDLYNTGGLIGSNTAAGNFINPTSSQPLNIGGGVSGQAWMKGRIDKVGIWRRLTGDPVNQTVVFNSGLGLTGSQVYSNASLTSGLVAWYDLDQRSGSPLWRDFAGNHIAVSTGNVLSVPKAGSF